MLNENAKKWVAALRSGEFKQYTGGGLRLGDRFCCLGVACEVAVRNGLPLKVTSESIRPGRELQFWYDSAGGFLPESVRVWLNISSTYATADSYINSLTRMNDSGASFSEIADVIESEPKGLFVAARASEKGE